jgi:glycosyltransferase involved in cell wall biosynthesis
MSTGPRNGALGPARNPGPKMTGGKIRQTAPPSGLDSGSYHGIRERLCWSPNAVAHRSEKPAVTVITVCRNAAELLATTIARVRRQQFRQFEYLVIDGGSTDRTLEVIKANADVITGWVSEPDKGIYDAMNKGIVAARGELINFLNAGDYYCSEEVLGLVARSHAAEAWTWAYGFARLQIGFRESRYRQPIRPYRAHRNWYLTQMCHQATFFERSLFARTGLYRTDHDCVADFEFNLRAADLVEPKMLPEYLVWYDITGISGRPRLSVARGKVAIVRERAHGLWRWVWPALLLARLVRSFLAYGVKRMLLRSQRGAAER